MKTTFLSILLSAVPVSTSLVRAQDEKHESPREEKKEGAEIRERIQAEKARFHEEMEKHMKAAMEEAAKLEAEGKKDEAEARRREAKEKMEGAIKEHQRATQARIQAEMRERAGADRGRDGAERDRPAPERGREGADRLPDGPPPPRAEIENKLRHVEQAIGHLREAGMPEPAENLERIAERLRGALRGEGGPPREDGRRGQPRREPDRPGGDIDALRRDIQELRQAVRELYEKQGEHRK